MLPSCPFYRLVSPPGFHITHIPKGNLVLQCINVFFWLIGIFLSSGRGSCHVLSAPWHAGSPPGHHGARLGPGRGPWHVLGEVKAASPIGEGFRGRRAIQVHSNARNGLEKCPTACACTSEFCRRLALDAGVSFFAPPLSLIHI